MSGAYYNEFDPYAAEWLRNLIKAGHIAPGDVDSRSIVDVAPDDLVGYTQCHFFAGIGVWSYALRRLAGWPDDRPVWTGSCPCQPFSAAGKQSGMSDDRHLWPVWFNLIRERQPDVVFGEQVESAIRHGWLDLVQADMEGVGYAFAPVGIPAAGFGAPHIRQRLWFVADATSEQCGARRVATACDELGQVERSARFCADGLMGDTERAGLEGLTGHGDGGGGSVEAGSIAAAGADGFVGNSADSGHKFGSWVYRVPESESGGHPLSFRSVASEPVRPGPTNGHWRDADWIFCRDGKWRPVESGTFPLAHGAPQRVGRLRAYGNAIVAQVAAEVIGAYLDVLST